MTLAPSVAPLSSSTACSPPPPPPSSSPHAARANMHVTSRARSTFSRADTVLSPLLLGGRGQAAAGLRVEKLDARGVEHHLEFLAGSGAAVGVEARDHGGVAAVTRQVLGADVGGELLEIVGLDLRAGDV